MAKQNIYDNEIFFDGYRKLRDREGNANELFESPALFSLLPAVGGKKILDLGCGCGGHCMKLAQMGAERVVGVDISRKMLEIARAENAHEKISYLNMAIEDISRLDERFDIAVSSLALHYVEDFDRAVKNVGSLLNDGGIFVFSQENPIVTCHSGGSRWTKDENGNKLYMNLANYSVEGERETVWFVDGVKKYHRMFSTVVNTLIENGFVIEKMVEPLPDEELLIKYPEQRDLLHKPDFMLIKARKG